LINRISLLSPDGDNRKMLYVSAGNPASGGVSFCLPVLLQLIPPSRCGVGGRLIKVTDQKQQLPALSKNTVFALFF
jgi:hypothetical protein